MEKNKQKNYCPKCGKEVIKSEIKGYNWQCLECDEDFYNFEIIKK